MQSLTLELPAMYGDHHVNEVRRILLGVPGIKNLYASSYLRTVEVSYDPERVSPSMVEGLLTEAGYLTTAHIEVEEPAAQGEPEKRQTTLDRHASAAISFAQDVPVAQSGAWPCPGIGVVTTNGTEV